MNPALVLLAPIASLLATQLLFAGHAALRWKVARRLGLQVERARFGWGPKLRTHRTRNGVQVEVRALPPLAMIAIRGHDPAPEQPRYRELYGRSDLGKRLLLTLSTPAYYVLLALLPPFALGLLAGWSEEVKTSVMVIGAVEPESPADDAGIEADDVIVSANGQPVHGVVDLIAVVAPRGGVPTAIELRRNGRTHAVNVTPMKLEGRGRIGVLPKPPKRIRKPLGALAAASRAVGFATTMFEQGVHGVFALFQPRREGLTGPVGMVALVADDARGPDLEFITVVATAYFVRYWLLLCLPLPFCTFGRLLLLLPEAVGRAQPSLRVERWMTRITVGAYAALIVLLAVRDVSG